MNFCILLLYIGCKGSGTYICCRQEAFVTLKVDPSPFGSGAGDLHRSGSLMKPHIVG